MNRREGPLLALLLLGVLLALLGIFVVYHAGPPRLTGACFVALGLVLVASRNGWKDLYAAAWPSMSGYGWVGWGIAVAIGVGLVVTGVIALATGERPD